MQVYTTDSSLHSASVNSVAFAPHELGLKVAAASSDGSASVLTYNTTEGKWDQQKVLGCLQTVSLVLHDTSKMLLCLHYIMAYASAWTLFPLAASTSE